MKYHKIWIEERKDGYFVVCRSPDLERSHPNYTVEYLSVSGVWSPYEDETGTKTRFNSLYDASAAVAKRADRFEVVRVYKQNEDGKFV